MQFCGLGRFGFLRFSLHSVKLSWAVFGSMGDSRIDDLSDSGAEAPVPSKPATPRVERQGGQGVEKTLRVEWAGETGAVPPNVEEPVNPPGEREKTEQPEGTKPRRSALKKRPAAQGGDLKDPEQIAEPSAPKKPKATKPEKTAPKPKAKVPRLNSAFDAVYLRSVLHDTLCQALCVMMLPSLSLIGQCIIPRRVEIVKAAAVLINDDDKFTTANGTQYQLVPYSTRNSCGLRRQPPDGKAQQFFSVTWVQFQ